MVYHSSSLEPDENELEAKACDPFPHNKPEKFYRTIHAFYSYESTNWEPAAHGGV